MKHCILSDLVICTLFKLFSGIGTVSLVTLQDIRCFSENNVYSVVHKVTC